MSRPIHRRTLLGAGASIPLVAGLAACQDGGTSGEPGTTELRLGWWGNPTRDQNTNDVLDLYAKDHPGLTIERETASFDSYWDRLSTQTAGGAMPDVIQMDMRYIREYGDRGSLLDLSQYDLNTDDFAPGTAEAGKTDSGLVGINAGVNAAAIVANPKLFEAAGVDLPDDETWTWDDFVEIARQITEGSGGEFHGTATSVGGIAGIEFWVRQLGKNLFGDNGLDFTVDDIVPFFEFTKSLITSEAAPSAAATVEDQSVPLAQQGFATERVAMAAYWSNQVNSLQEATGQDVALLRYPSMEGTAEAKHYWYKASMLWSASAESEHPEAAVELIDFLVNGEEAAKIIKAERGVPPNLKLRELIQPDLTSADAKAVDFLDLLEPSLAPSPIAPPPGSGVVDDSLTRQKTEMLFDRLSPAEAAEAFYNESVEAIKP